MCIRDSLMRIKDKMYENRSETKITEYGVRILNKIDATPIEKRHLAVSYTHLDVYKRQT